MNDSDDKQAPKITESEKVLVATIQRALLVAVERLERASERGDFGEAAAFSAATWLCADALKQAVEALNVLQN